MSDTPERTDLEKILNEESRIVRWWISKIRRELDALDGVGWGAVQEALQELSVHLKKRYDLEESEGLFDESYVESPQIQRQMRRIFRHHHELEGRLGVLLNDLKAHPKSDVETRAERVNRFLEDWYALEQSETHFVQRVAYEEYGQGS